MVTMYQPFLQQITAWGDRARIFCAGRRGHALRILGWWFVCVLLGIGCWPPGRCVAADPFNQTESSDRPPAQVADDRPPEELIFEDIPVVVTASKKAERVSSAPSIMSVITRKEIEQMGARTLTDVLRTIPGIEIFVDQFNLSQIAVRGLSSSWSKGVKIMLNGHTLNDPITGGATVFYDDLFLRHVKRIEVIRGPASALYGANAFVSAINIITKEVQDIHGIEVAVNVGSNRTLQPSFQFGKLLNDLEVNLSADYATTQGAELTMNRDLFTVYDSYSASVGWPQVSLAPGTLRDEREQLNLAYRLGYRDLTLQGGLLYSESGPFLSEYYALNSASSRDARHFFGELGYHRFLTDRVEFTGKLYADHFRLAVFEQAGAGLRRGVADNLAYLEYPTGVSSEFYGLGQRLGGEGQVDFRLFHQNDLTLGVAYEYFTVQDVAFRTNESNPELGLTTDTSVNLRDVLPNVATNSFQNFAAIFAQDTWRIGSALDLVLGLRGDYYSKFGGVLTPKVALVYEPLAKVNLKLLYGSAFRVPSFFEFFIPEEKNLPDVSPALAADLAAEVLGTFETGLGFQPFDWLIGEVNYFHTDINELIEASERSVGGALIGTTRPYRNVGELNSQGVEVELRANSETELTLGFIPRIIGSTLRLNYSYLDLTDARTRESGIALARHKGNVGLGLTLSAEQPSPDDLPTVKLFQKFSDEFALYLNLFLCDERPRLGNDPRSALPGYRVVDLTLTSYDFLHRGVDFSFTVKNLFDATYRHPSSVFIEDPKLALQPDDIPMPGRAFFVEIRYTF